MALTNTNIPNAASDVVGVFDQSFAQVFSTARPIKALIDENAKAFEHPVEKGVVITDHIIFQPNEIELLMVLPANEYRSVYQQIEQLYKAGTVLNVQTRAATYINMFIYKLPHQEDTDLFNTITLSIRLREILIIETTTQALPPTAVQNPSDQSTITTGLQQPAATQVLPAPAAFNAAIQSDATDSGAPPPGIDPNHLPPGVQGPAPNAQSYATYQSDFPEINTPSASALPDLTTSQLNQLLNASRSSNTQ